MKELSLFKFIKNSRQLSQGVSTRAKTGYRPVFGDFVPVLVPAGILVLAGILAGIFPK